MTVDGRKILKRLEARERTDRGRVTLYISKGVYRDFKKLCGDLPVSVVLEEVLLEFVETANKRR